MPGFSPLIYTQPLPNPSCSLTHVWLSQGGKELVKSALGASFTEAEIDEAWRLQLPCLEAETIKGYAGYETKWLAFLRGRNLEDQPCLQSLATGAQVVVVSRWLQELSETGVHGQAVAALRYFFAKNGESVELFNLEELGRVREHLRPSDRDTHERRKSTTKVAASKQFVEIQELLHWNEGIDGKMRVAAIAYEFAFGTRVGNIGWDSKSRGKHMLRVEDVEFWLRGPDDGHSYHSFELGLQQVSSEDCFRIVVVHVSGKNFGGKKGPLTNVLDRKVSPDKDGKLIDMLFEFAIGA